MTEANGSATGEGSTDQNEESKENSGNDSGKGKDDFVPKSAYEGVKGDLHKWKTRAKENEKNLNKLKDEFSALKERLEGEDDWKTKADRYKSEADEWKGKAQNFQKGLVYTEKHRAVFAELKKLGLRDDAERYLEYEDFEDIEVETTSKGRVEVLGAKDWAANYYNRNKILFESKKSPGVNSSDGRGTGSGESEKITPSMVVEAERLAKKTGKPEHMAEYKKKLELYNKQRRA
jgi:hypothetical protein